MIIREVQPHDNERLLALEMAASQGEQLKLITERTDYLTRANKFSNPILLLAEDDKMKELLGVMGIGPIATKLQGKTLKGGYIFDWRSNSTLKGLNRGRGILRLWQALQAHIEEEGIDFLFGFVKEDNLRSLSILTRAGTRVIGEKIFFTIPLHRRFARTTKNVSLSCDIDPVKEYNFQRKQWGQLDFFPHYTDESHLNYARQYIYGRIDKGHSSLKVWDSTSEYNLRVMQIPQIFRWARPVFNLLSPILPLPRIPAEGDLIKNWFLFDVFIEQASDLPPMLEKTRLIAKKHHIDFLIYVRDAAGHPLPYLEKKAWYKVKYKTLFMPLKQIPDPVNPTFYDVAFL